MAPIADSLQTSAPDWVSIVNLNDAFLSFRAAVAENDPNVLVDGTGSSSKAIAKTGTPPLKEDIERDRGQETAEREDVKITASKGDPITTTDSVVDPDNMKRVIEKFLTLFPQRNGLVYDDGKYEGSIETSEEDLKVGERFISNGSTAKYSLIRVTNWSVLKQKIFKNEVVKNAAFLLDHFISQSDFRELASNLKREISILELKNGQSIIIIGSDESIGGAVLRFFKYNQNARQSVLNFIHNHPQIQRIQPTARNGMPNQLSGTDHLKYLLRPSMGDIVNSAQLVSKGSSNVIFNSYGIVVFGNHPELPNRFQVPPGEHTSLRWEEFTDMYVDSLVWKIEALMLEKIENFRGSDVAQAMESVYAEFGIYLRMIPWNQVADQNIQKVIGKSQDELIEKTRRTPYSQIVEKILYLSPTLDIDDWRTCINKISDLQTKHAIAGYSLQLLPDVVRNSTRLTEPTKEEINQLIRQERFLRRAWWSMTAESRTRTELWLNSREITPLPESDYWTFSPDKIPSNIKFARENGFKAPPNSFISYFTSNPRAILSGMALEIAAIVTSYGWFSQAPSLGVIAAIVLLHIVGLVYALASGRAPPAFLKSAPIVHGIQFGLYATAVWTHADPVLSAVILSLAVLIHVVWDVTIVRGDFPGSKGETRASYLKTTENETSPAKELASRMIQLFKTAKNDRKALAEAIFNLVEAEKAFGEDNTSGATGKSAPWQDVARQLLSELREMKASGRFDLNRDGERVANLFSILGLVLSKKENQAFAQEFNEIFINTRYTEAIGTAARVNNAAQAKRIINRLPDGQRIVLGIETSQDQFLEELASLGIDTGKLMRENRLGFVTNCKSMNALEFVQAAKQAGLFGDQKQFKLRLLVWDGVTLTPTFFDFKTDFERNQLVREAFVFFITQNFQAIEINTKLLPDWNDVRTRLIQA